MINSKRNLTVIEIWTRLSYSEKERIMKKFPDGRTIDDPEVKEYLLKNYKDRLAEIVIK